MTLPLPDTTELRKERRNDASWSLRRQRAHDIVRLQHEVSCLKSKLAEVTLSEEALKANDSMVLFYTGLPNWELLSVL